MLKGNAEYIDNSPNHRVKVKSTNLPPFIAFRTYTVVSENSEQKEVLIAKASPALINRLHKREKSKFQNYEECLNKYKRQTSIGTAKNLAVNVLEQNNGMDFELVAYKFGVIPVIEIESEIEIELESGCSRYLTLCLYDNFPSQAKDRNFEQSNSESQLPLSFENDDGYISEDLITLKGYDIDLLSCFENAFSYIDNYFELILNTSNFQYIFDYLHEIKALVATSIKIKIDLFKKFKDLKVPINRAEQDEARQIVERNIDWIIWAELKSYLVFRSISLYLSLFSIKYNKDIDVDYFDFKERLIDDWGLDAGYFEDNSFHAIDVLHKCCRKISNITALNDSDLEEINSVNLAEFIQRTTYLKQENVLLWVLNVFVSRKTDCEFSQNLIEYSNEFPNYIKLRMYYKNKPTKGDFPKEISWYIWGSSIFLSVLSNKSFNRERNMAQDLSWIVRELDLAIQQQNFNIGIIKGSQVDTEDLIKSINTKSWELYRGFKENTSERINSVISKLDRNKTIHFEYNNSDDFDSIENVGERTLNWLEEEKYVLAESFIKGWISLFSDINKTAIRFLILNEGKILSTSRLKDNLSKLENKSWSSGRFKSFRESIRKHPMIIDDQEFTIVKIIEGNKFSGDKYAFQSNLKSICNKLYRFSPPASLFRSLFEDEYKK